MKPLAIAAVGLALVAGIVVGGIMSEPRATSAWQREPVLTPTPTAIIDHDVTLVGGVCSPKANTFPDNTDIKTIAGAVFPNDVLECMWTFDVESGTWLGYSPLFPAVSNLAFLHYLDAVFICVRSGASWNAPYP